VAKSKSKAIVSVNDGAGGMMRVEDRRFDATDWPVTFMVADRDHADRWLAHLNEACSKRGWSSAGLTQLDRPENSGSITIITIVGGQAEKRLAVVWDRKRNKGLKVQARSLSADAISNDEARAFLDEVTDACRRRLTQKLYRRISLEYNGLAWRGELWLDDGHRLAPPSKQYDVATRGPRFVHLDAMVECAGPSELAFAATAEAREVAAFLSVAMGRAVSVMKQGNVWTYEEIKGNPDWSPSCKVRFRGYLEAVNPTSMPDKGTVGATSLAPAASLRSGVEDESEIVVRDDVASLWRKYRSLPADLRDQFYRAATMWQQATSLPGDFETLAFALMVAACEILLPPGEKRNLYDVVEGLFGRSEAEGLRKMTATARKAWRGSDQKQAHDIRSLSLHAGEFFGNEVMRNLAASYRDPSFTELRFHLEDLAPRSIIEWLLQGGAINLPPLRTRVATSNARRSRRVDEGQVYGDP
jgi:hypothetical protein